MDLSEALHIVTGDSAAGTLRMAHHLRRDRVLVNEDPISVGPATFSGDLGSWRQSRERFLADLYLDWPDFSFDSYSENGLLSNAHRLREPADKVIWAGAGLLDQLSIAWVFVLAHHLRVDASRFYVVQFARLGTSQIVLGMGELSVDRIRESSPGVAQTGKAEISEYDKAWAVYTSNDPVDLLRYLESPTKRPVLHHAMRSLVLRYPDKRSGISYCDELILKYTREKGPRAVRVVGHTMAFNESMDDLGDSYIFNRILRLSQATLNRPLLQLSGNPKDMRRSEVRLTDFGRDVMLGKANAIDHNGVEDWIGGVHLRGNRPLAYRAGENLVLDT